MLDVDASGQISEEDFIKRNSAIYEGIEVHNITTTIISYDAETPSGYPFMRKKTRDDKVNVQTVDCLMCGECIDKCPEDKALSMTFCGKAFYQSSRKTFMSKFARKQGAGKE